MSRDKIEFWALVVVGSTCSLVPTYPPLLLLWITVSLIWDRYYGPSWYRFDRKNRKYSFFLFDFLICLPLALIDMLSVLISKGGLDD